ncbi:MAG: glycosyltransferase family 2 protein [Vicinamibacterales bacterium]
MRADRSHSSTINQPLVSVVLLSYNRPQLLGRALETVLSQSWPNVELIVVDNRSAASDEIARLVERYPRARLLANPVNLGFTSGMNEGIAEARGQFVYLTEDDIEMEPDCLQVLVEYLAGHPDVGLAGPIMLNHHNGTVRCAGGHFELGTVYRMTIHGADAPFAASNFPEPYSVTFLPGATMMTRLDLLRDLHGFRDEFFMYVEDIDLCARVLRRGLTIAVVPRARVSHHLPEPGVAPTLEFHKVKNLSALYLMHAPLRVLPLFVFRYGMLGAIRALASGRVGSHLRAWAWTFWNTPRLLTERRQFHASATPPAAPVS